MCPSFFSLACLLLISTSVVFSHNVLTFPNPRTHQNWGYPTDHVPASRIWQSGAPVEPLNGRNDSAFTCRNRLQEEPSSVIEAGKTLSVKYDVWASHPGDCALYISYDLDPIVDTEKRWIKIYEWRDCGCNVDIAPCDFVPVIGPFPKKVEVPIPSWLPATNHAIFRYEMYATHMRFNNNLHPFMLVELYANCADIQIINPNPKVINTLPTPTYKIMNHLPTDPAKYRAQWDLNAPTAFPPNSNPGVPGGEPINSTTIQPISTSNTSNNQVYIPIEQPIPPDTNACSKISRGLAVGERKLIWKMHNEFRAKVAEGKEATLPMGAGIPEIVWDVELMDLAQAYADGCPANGSGDAKFGEIFYVERGSVNIRDKIEDILKGWYNEVKLFDPSRLTNFEPSESYSRFSQMIWGKTTRLGCGASSFQSYSENISVLICKYAEKGNIPQKTIYEPGPTGSKCSAKAGDWFSLCWTSPAGKPYVSTGTNSTAGATTKPSQNQELPSGQKACTRQLNIEECSKKGICLNGKCLCFEGQPKC